GRPDKAAQHNLFTEGNGGVPIDVARFDGGRRSAGFLDEAQRGVPIRLVQPFESRLYAVVQGWQSSVNPADRRPAFGRDHDRRGELRADVFTRLQGGSL